VRSRVVAELVALFAPPGCAACRTPLEDAREAVCPDCRRSLPWLRGPRCERCGLPSPCAPCPAARAAFDTAWSPHAYAGPARDLVAALKFGGALALADLMAAQITAAAPTGLLRSDSSEAASAGPPGAVAVVPVPAHPKNVRVRGFDQAEVLAAAVSTRTGLPLDACLSRTGTARRQVGRSRTRRMSEPIAMEAREVAENVVLVDDVHTTGATLEAAARALKRAGATRVDAVTYARTLRH
jgi:predicted amidophosphoribosyltransferase